MDKWNKIIEERECYLVARWEKLSKESKELLGLQYLSHRNFIEQLWIKQFYENKLRQLICGE